MGRGVFDKLRIAEDRSRFWGLDLVRAPTDPCVPVLATPLDSSTDVGWSRVAGKAPAFAPSSRILTPRFMISIIFFSGTGHIWRRFVCVQGVPSGV